ncbi:MAG TPA: MOSC domain-containing protein [Baekduia sp.]|uniref:MOSC domain-containing protein n=1 Tax=Baekduia sp. TaxID=2600305 RepID=UPI002D76CD15|nr:MOSC domain-containing protein [Baekduia sp.]HET6505503.1 MOSC domain-containing protein [Baekduia sp.]
MPAGAVASLHRWPVKSLAGEDADALWLDGRGVAGDRAHALYDTFKDEPRRLTVRQAPGMLRWRAAYAQAPGDTLRPGAVPLPTITAPTGETFAWDDPALPAALGDDLGRTVTLRRDEALMQDLNDSVLVTTQATLEALAAALGDDALDLRRFRTNVHVVLGDGTAPFAENDWEGRALRVGDVTLDLLHPCARCVIPTRDPDTTVKDPNILKWLTRHREGLFGINARMRGSGRIAVGDPVELL